MQALRSLALEVGRAAAVVSLVAGVAIALDLVGAVDTSRRSVVIVVAGISALLVSGVAARHAQTRAQRDAAPTP